MWGGLAQDKLCIMTVMGPAHGHRFPIPERGPGQARTGHRQGFDILLHRTQGHSVFLCVSTGVHWMAQRKWRIYMRVVPTKWRSIASESSAVGVVCPFLNVPHLSASLLYQKLEFCR
jgi:hypothetical protein